MGKEQQKASRKSFYIILVILPFFLLAVLEGMLRLADFGNSYPLFITTETPKGYMQPNPELIKRYFTNPDLAPAISPDTVFFSQKKQPQSVRIVVQGGSSAAGFPYGRFGSLAGMLHQRFKREYPDLHIEIINTAMSAVNSYTLLDLTDEIIAIDPDLILIYAGHNEFLGVMGVGSTFAARGGHNATLLFLTVKELRIYQLMQRLYQLFIPKPDTSQVTDRTLMAEVAAGQKIPLDSDLYQQGLDQFSGNLDLILERYGAHGIPVVIGTLASNEKDQKPFSSETGAEGANEIYADAESLRDKGQFEQALMRYQEARDKDLLRFRAPSTFNGIIRDKAALPGVYIAESEQTIRNDATDNIIGFEHMLEHLHPNARGYFLLAEAFAEVISREKKLGLSAQSITREIAWNDVPLNEVDTIVGDIKIQQLTSDYPFSEHQKPAIVFDQSRYEYKIANARINGAEWLATMNDMLRTYQQQNRIPEAAKVAATMFDAIPDQHQIAYIAGQLYFRVNDIGMALYYHKKALAMEPNNVNYVLMTARSQYANRNLEASVGLLERAVQLAPDNQQAMMQLKRIKTELENE